MMVDVGVVTLVDSGQRFYPETKTFSSWFVFEDVVGRQYGWIAYKNGWAYWEYQVGTRYQLAGRLKSVFKQRTYLTNCKLQTV